MKPFQHLHFLLAFGLGVLALGESTMADTFPSRPMKLVVPLPTGGSSDIIARRFADALREQMGSAVVVENKPGASGAIGGEFVAKSAPDGYTLLYATDAFLTTPLLRKDAPFQLNDFAPIARLRLANLYLVVNKNMPASSIAELMTLIKSKPGQYMYGTGGDGTIMHITGEQMAQAAGLSIQSVPYRGIGPALVDTVSGHIPMTITGGPDAQPYQKSGQIKVLASFSAQRSTMYPHVPTFAESGYPDLVAYSMASLVAPAKTPAAVLAYLHDKVTAAATSPKFLTNGDSLELSADVILGGEPFGVWLNATRSNLKKAIDKGHLKIAP